MAKQQRGRPQAKPDDEPLEEGGSSFAWEFVNDEHVRESPAAPPRLRDGMNVRPRGRDGKPVVIDGDASPLPETPQPVTDLRREKAKRAKPTALPNDGRMGPARANYIRDQLDRALDRWWALGELPPLPLLRDGLLMLEAGGSASESQRTLLLRAALAHNRGIQTALRHQVDAERIALVLAEALIEWEVPLEPEQLPTLLADEAQVQSLLVAELERSRVLLTGESRRRAVLALDMLPRPMSKERIPKARAPVPAATVSGRRPLRQLLLLLLLLAFVGFILWQQRQRMPDGMILMPAAAYGLLTLDGDGAAESVPLEAFFIDRFEATNRDYRACVEAGKCAWPLQTNSATRADYFTNPAFDGYPVVNVTLAMAATYCAWQDKRLPSAGEWQAAASVSTTTGQFFRFPWGESFEAQRTNSAGTGNGDTVVVGSFRPAGDSPSGVADMAGNVAEWTTSLVPGSEERALAIVKGGSFADDADGVEVSAQAHLEVSQASPQVGFRCARSHSLASS